MWHKPASNTILYGMDWSICLHAILMSSCGHGSQGITALIYAASLKGGLSYDNRKETVDKLLYHGADIHARDNEVKLPFGLYALRYVQLMKYSIVAPCVCYVSDQHYIAMRQLAQHQVNGFPQRSNCWA